MIRKLVAADDAVVMPFLLREPTNNLFVVGDIYNNDYQCDFQELWCDWCENGELRAVLCFFREVLRDLLAAGRSGAGDSRIGRDDAIDD